MEIIVLAMVPVAVMTVVAVAAVTIAAVALKGTSAPHRAGILHAAAELVRAVRGRK
ncbi:hypothetical protein [Streptomyces canus]|uniref:hypothetical protein n=1 Tax=Streptomyces canus TaxID=58343 RepID=UPI002DD7B399|nr:hypothetical protein [Streptomyces canus]WSD88055.1 hypothetical protein OG925_28875 [Streptomyces canus]